jgi:transposase
MNGQVKSKTTQRRYSEELKQRAVRLVFQLREETGEKQGSVKRVADQLDIGVESLRSWVNQAEIDGGWRAGTTSADAAELKVLRQEVKELRRANAILKSASAFFAAELDRPQK